MISLIAKRTTTSCLALLGCLLLISSWGRPAQAQQWLPGGVGSPIVCAFNNSPPTVATGLFVYAQCNSSGQILTTSSSGSGSAVFPSGGAAGSSNGLGNTDSNAFDATLSGAALTGWSAPGGCTFPGSNVGSLSYQQCLINIANSAIFFTNNTHVNSTALENGHVMKNAAGTLFGFYCTAIAGSATGNCIAVNAASVPSTGTITGVLDSCYISGPAGCSLNRIPIGISAGTGIVVLISSAASPFTYTTGTLTGFISADIR